MRTSLAFVLGAAAIVAFAGCASKPVSLPAVGPQPLRPDISVGRGYLRVFTETETHEIGENTFYYPHVGYEIFSVSGQRIEHVANHIGDTDETPALVPIPAGRYLVVAESAAFGRVHVPVIIRAGRVTVVHLNRDQPPMANTPPDKLVHLPDGEIVGWRG